LRLTVIARLFRRAFFRDGYGNPQLLYT